jgi:probable HAF family extracellular repeat protein
MSMGKSLFAGVVLAIMAASAQSVSAQGSVLTDLGTLGGTNSTAHGVNDSGQVVGVSDIAGNTAQHAFLWSSGTMIDLGTLGGTNSVAYGINSFGQVVGSSDIEGDAVQHAFLWWNGTMTDLSSLEDRLRGINSIAYAINDSGRVVGYSHTLPGEDVQAFLWVDGTKGLLAPYGDSAFATANAINDSGQIVGAATPDGYSQPYFHASLWTSGSTFTDLGTLGLSCTATGINDSEQIVGTSVLVNLVTYEAFLWSDGVMIGLGTLGGENSYASGINNSGHIAGFSDIFGDAAEHACLWSNGTRTDLGTLGGTNSHAYAINDDGLVVGDSQIAGNGASHATLWTPIPGNRPPVVQDQILDLAAGLTRPRTPIGTVEADDPDAGQELIYSIVSGNKLLAFALDPATGELTVRNPLAVIRPAAFTLRVRVTDNATPPLSAEATITVNVMSSSAATVPVASPTPARRR